MQLSILQIANAWLAAGGPESRVVEFTAIALGESSGETSAVSSAGAEGTWQIMPEHWAALGLDGSRWADPVVNARAAVMLSGHGTNCAAWDSAYRDIYASGRYAFLAWPEPGSADYGHMQQVAVVLGRDKLGGSVPHGGLIPGKSVEHAVSHLQLLAAKFFPALDRIVIAERMAVNRMFIPGKR